MPKGKGYPKKGKKSVMQDKKQHRTIARKKKNKA